MTHGVLVRKGLFCKGSVVEWDNETGRQLVRGLRCKAGYDIRIWWSGGKLIVQPWELSDMEEIFR